MKMQPIIAVACTKAQLAEAFEEWRRSYEDDPGGFLTEEEVADLGPATYGEQCAAELVALLARARL